MKKSILIIFTVCLLMVALTVPAFASETVAMPRADIHCQSGSQIGKLLLVSTVEQKVGESREPCVHGYKWDYYYQYQMADTYKCSLCGYQLTVLSGSKWWEFAFCTGN